MGATAVSVIGKAAWGTAKFFGAGQIPILNKAAGGIESLYKHASDFIDGKTDRGSSSTSSEDKQESKKSDDMFKTLKGINDAQLKLESEVYQLKLSYINCVLMMLHIKDKMSLADKTIFTNQFKHQITSSTLRKFGLDGKLMPISFNSLKSDADRNLSKSYYDALNSLKQIETNINTKLNKINSTQSTLKQRQRQLMDKIAAQLR